MSTSQAAAPKAPVKHSKDSATLKVLLPYLVAIGAQIPMLLLYFKGLWAEPHYQTFVFGILATAAIAWSRWPRDEEMPFHRSLFSTILLFAGLACGLAGVVFLEAWFHAASCMLLVMSLLAKTVDPDTGRGMWTAALPLFVFLQLPMGWDTRLITTLQRISARFTSALLDLISYGHLMDGTLIQVPGREEGYGIAEACSGVQSFFTLLFVAVVFVVWNRRPMFRSILLLISAVFWALFMNTVRIFLIPVADNVDINLADGIAHDILGWTVMTLGILLLFSTDQFLLFLFGPVEAETGRSGPLGKFITTIWNKILAGDVSDDSSRRKSKRRKPVTSLGSSIAWGTAGLLLLLSLWQAGDIWKSFSAPKNNRVTFFSTDVTKPYSEADMPKQLDDWTLVRYEAEDRKRGSDLGLRSDSWIYQSPRYAASTSLDQTFPGWHELTTCYRNQGWKMENREHRSAVISSNDEENEREWDYIVAEFSKNTGERGFLVFSFFDAFGEPVFAPSEWGTFNAFLIRAKNRLSHKIRGSLFRAEAYQTQAFVRQFGEIEESTKDEVVDHYLKAREIMRKAYKAKVDSGAASGETVAP